MALSSGAWLNHYEVLSHLGTGASQSRERERPGVSNLSRDREGAVVFIRAVPPCTIKERPPSLGVSHDAEAR